MFKALKENWFRCRRCGKVEGPYSLKKEVCFCPHCGTIMEHCSRTQAKKQRLHD